MATNDTNTIPKDDEIWRDVVDFEGKYKVSNYGRVQSFMHLKPVILHGRFDQDGYVRVRLSLGSRRRWHVFAHRLVMQAFVGSCPVGLEINHVNGVKHDNRLSNLEYCTSSENKLHAFRLGLRRNLIGQDSHAAKLTDSDVRQIKQLLASGVQGADVARLTGMSRAQISRINTGKHWLHVTA